MGTADRLLQFAAREIAGIQHHAEVRTAQLAEAFRTEFALGAFPRLPDLLRAAREAGVLVERIPLPFDGVNTWAGDQPLIQVDSSLAVVRAETTLAHELREVIEHAFKRVEPAYDGLATNDNKTMNPESDQFGGHLLMQPEASRRILTRNGFDFARFASEHERSIASVVAHAQTLFPKSYAEDAPTAGVWLYERPWGVVESGPQRPSSFRVTQVAHLMGFSMATRRKPPTVNALVFPRRGTTAEGVEIVCEALATRGNAFRRIGGYDLFGLNDFAAVAEPLYTQGAVRQVLLTAVRIDCLDLVEPWLQRIRSRGDGKTHQRL
jgi:hypothetical protein